jgi:5,6,7,8-tetrahydromethanopterin hydro-lyase
MTVVWIGESFIGSGGDAAHVNTVLGERDGPVGTAWATALATPSAGHAPFMVVLQPGLPVQPPTLFVNKAAIANDEHGRLTWGAAQAGIADGVMDAHRAGTFESFGVPRDLVLITAVWVNPLATDEDEVHANNRAAVAAALAAGRDAEPTIESLLAAGGAANPFFRS